ncbi:MAG: alpha/beta fold hydrolase [Bacteriovoracaceae bacterium]|nr:alpha/beta fold hydrolase [Bacteriovoracaceae bacterium]
MKAISILLTSTVIGLNLSHSSNSEIREGMRTINGTKLFVREVGPIDAPVLIVVHGGPGGNHLQLRALEQYSPDFRVILYDQRGTGKSERLQVSISNPDTFRELSLDKNIEDLEGLRKSLNAEKISLIGHSFGGALVTFYAAKYPDKINKLVVYSGGPEDRELFNLKNKAHMNKMTSIEQFQLKKITESLQLEVEGNASQNVLDQSLIEAVKLMIPSLNCQRPTESKDLGHGGFWANYIVGQYVDTFNRIEFAKKLKTFKFPTLLMWGRCEPSPQERLLYLLDHIPNAQFAIFENSGHNAMEEEPGLFFETLEEFLYDKTIQQKTYRSRLEVQEKSNE